MIEFLKANWNVILSIILTVASNQGIKKSKLESNDILELIANVAKSLKGIFKKV